MNDAADITANVAAPSQTNGGGWDPGHIEVEVVMALSTVFDPEIPVNIVDLGLVYRIDVSRPGFVEIDMTLTAPGCPVAGEMMGWVQKAVTGVEMVEDAKINLVFDPPWDQSKMAEAAKLELGLL